MNKKIYKLMNWPMIEGVIYNEEKNPYCVLGPKKSGNNTLYETFYPGASKIDLIIKDNKKEERISMEMADELGFFAQLVSGKAASDYEYEITVTSTEEKVEDDSDEKVVVSRENTLRIKDAYAFSYDEYRIKDVELEKLSKGILYNSYDFLGSHLCKVNGVSGVKFAVWAPNALSVSVVGDFNGYVAGVHQMICNDQYGVYELFIPGIGSETKYQYALKVKGGKTLVKNDPYARKISSDNVSVVTHSNYAFKDVGFKKVRRNHKGLNGPISIYELNLSKLIEDNKKKSFDEVIKKTIAEIKEQGFTHVVLMPIAKYSYSMYQVDSFYAVDNKIGTTDEIKSLVDLLHENGIGVVISFTPFNFEKNPEGLVGFDGTCLYEHMDECRGTHPFLGTKQFNYGRAEVSNYLISCALYYLEEFHIDGLLLDSVSSMIYLDYGRSEGQWHCNIYGGNEDLDAIELIKHLNSIVSQKYPDVLMIAQDDSGYPNTTASLKEGGLGFDLKLNENMVKDSCTYLAIDPFFRSKGFDSLTLSMVYQYSERFISALSNRCNNGSFESILDVFPGEEEDKIANLKLLLTYIYFHPGFKLINDGNDLGKHKGIKKLITALNKLYGSEKAFTTLDDKNTGFEWINGISNDDCILSFIRKTDKETESLLCVFNFANSIKKVSVGTDLAGKYKELLNTDDSAFLGQNRINKRNIPVSEIGADGKMYSVPLKLAPLSASVFRYIPFTEAEKYKIEKRKEAAIANTKAAEYEELAKIASDEANRAKERMELAMKEMKEAEERAKIALENSKKEIEKAKKALEESK